LNVASHASQLRATCRKNPLETHLCNYFFKQKPVQLSPQTGGKICTCLAFMNTLELREGFAENFKEFHQKMLFLLKFIKSFRFKGKTVKESKELLPNSPFLWNFSCLLDFKGIILTNPKEL